MRWLERAGTLAAVALLALAVTAVGGPDSLAQAPPLPSVSGGLPPARFFGAIAVDGAAPALGSAVLATIAGSPCGQGLVREIDGLGVGYAVDVASASQQPGCGSEGATVAFRWADGAAGEAACAPTAPWDNSRFQRLDLACLRPIALRSGANAVLYSGLTAALPAALTNVASLVQAVFLFDTARQGWSWFFPAAGPDVNTLGELVRGQIYWLLASAAADWQPQP